MQIIRQPKALMAKLERVRKRGRTIGFVPTMGALHEGHLSLVRAAQKENDVVVVSLFVNPTQFGPKEDFKRYPRTFKRDSQLLRKEKTQLLFYPAVKVMYPEGLHSKVRLRPWGDGIDLTNKLCGLHRPGHFDGVITVVTKLFNIVLPHRAYFGAKDYQQAQVVKQIIRDFHFSIQLKILPTVREKDGLAVSSRNRCLSDLDRQRACMLSKTLFRMKKRLEGGRPNLKKLRTEALAQLRPMVEKIDYFEIVDPQSLKRLSKWQPEMVVVGACFVGKTRLIDNDIIRVRPKEKRTKRKR